VEWVTQPTALNPHLTFFLLRLEAQAVEQGLKVFSALLCGVSTNLGKAGNTFVARRNMGYHKQFF
jgi:hypothetical protein